MYFEVSGKMTRDFRTFPLVTCVKDYSKYVKINSQRSLRNIYYYELTLRILLADFDSITYLFTVESVYIRVTSGDVRSGVADRDSQNIGILRIFHRRYIVGTLTNKANISI